MSQIKHRLSKIIFKPPIDDEKQQKHITGPRISFELIKINSHGTRQHRMLTISEEGISNMKGKQCRWFYPSEDVYGIEQDGKQQTHLKLSVIKHYIFEAATSTEAARIVQVFNEFYNNGKVLDKKKISNFKEEKKSVNIDDFELIKIIGRGNFGRVVLVRKKDNKKLYALKVLFKQELKRLNQVEHIKTEKLILSKHEHPFIVKMYYSFQSADKLYMVLEYVDGGELFFHLKRARRFPENLACFYTAEVVLALEYLHKHDIIYRDLKPENILLTSEGHIKLTDFGLSKIGVTSVGGSEPGSKTRTFCGTPDYLAPEIIAGLPHGRGVDWWGLGVLLYEMLTGQPPFKGQTRNELYEQTLKGDIVFPEGISSTAKSIILELLCKEPEKRLGSKGAQYVKDHEFFKKHNIDWDKLLKQQIDPPFKPFVTQNHVKLNETSDSLEALVLPKQGITKMSPSFSGFSYNGDKTLENV